MFSLILISILVFIIFLVYAVVAAARNKEGGNGSVIRHLYVYLVLFATLMMVIGGGISVFMAAADLVSPPEYYQSYTDYKHMVELEKEGENKKSLSEEEIRANYEQIVKDERKRQQANAKNQIIKSLGFIIIPLPIFIYFNRLRKRTNE